MNRLLLRVFASFVLVSFGAMTVVKRHTADEFVEDRHSWRERREAVMHRQRSWWRRHIRWIASLAWSARIVIVTAEIALVYLIIVFGFIVGLALSALTYAGDVRLYEFGRIVPPTAVACRSRNDWAKFYALLDDDDVSSAFAFARDHCTEMEIGTSVKVERVSGEALCVRPQGAYECLWILSKLVAK